MSVIKLSVTDVDELLSILEEFLLSKAEVQVLPEELEEALLCWNEMRDTIADITGTPVAQTYAEHGVKLHGIMNENRWRSEARPTVYMGQESFRHYYPKKAFDILIDRLKTNYYKD